MLAQTTTHATLLARVSTGGDQSAWWEFCDRYEELIRGFARRQGVMGADADDVLQDVLMALAKAMPGFKYDPSKGKFRSYLKTVVVRSIYARFRQTPAARSLEDVSRTSVPAPADADADPLWEAEWRQYHLRQAMRTLRSQVSETDFLAFEAYARRGRDAAEVARELGLSVDQVYQAKSRIIRKLGELIATQVEEEG